MFPQPSLTLGPFVYMYIQFARLDCNPSAHHQIRLQEKNPHHQHSKQRKPTCVCLHGAGSSVCTVSASRHFYWLYSIACTTTSQPPHGQGCPGLSRGAGRDARKVAGMGMWHYKHFVLGYTSSYPWSTESCSGVLSPGGTWAWWRETSEGPQKR